MGQWGTGEGQFNGPQGLAIDSSANVYVADTGNNRIQKFQFGRRLHHEIRDRWSGNGQLS